MSRLVRGIAGAMLCLLPFSLLQAEIQGAMLYTRGMVRVNGNMARNSSPLLAGDSLQTDATGTAQIISEGSFVQVQPSSSLVFNKSAVTVREGIATVSSTKKLLGQVNNLTVSAVGTQSTRYSLIRQNGKVQVAALMGNVLISGDAKPVELKMGEVYTQDSATSPSPSPSPQTNNTGFFGNEDAGLIFAVSSAIIAGITLGIVYSQSVSPSNP